VLGYVTEVQRRHCRCACRAGKERQSSTGVYHLAWMYSDLGLNVIAADLDPQANLISIFLDDDWLEEIWTDHGHSQTIYAVFQPLLKGTGDVAAPIWKTS